jgi:membrane protein
MAHLNFAEQRQAAVTGLKLLLRISLREFNEGGLKFRAMSLVYTSLLALAPLLAVSFSILKAFGVHNQIQALLTELLAPLRGNAQEVTDKIITFVDNIQVGVLGFVGFLTLFYTAVSLLEQVEECFNHIWRVAKPRSLYRRFSDYLSVIMIGPVLLFSGLGIAASMTSTALVQRLIALEPFGTVYYLAGLILPYVLMIAAFTFVYAFIPNTPVKLRPALIGGVCAGLVWKATGFIFAVFIVDSAQYSAIYSGFAVILVAMIWLYLSWLILLLGGVMTFYIQFPHYLSYASRSPRLSIRSQEQLGLLLMHLIGRQYLQGGAACTLQSLSETINMPWEPVAALLACLQQHGLVVVIDGDTKTYRPAHDTDTILLRDIIRAIRSDGDQPALQATDSLQALFSELDGSIGAVLQERNLRELVTAKIAPPPTAPT